MTKDETHDVLDNLFNFQVINGKFRLKILKNDRVCHGFHFLFKKMFAAFLDKFIKRKNSLLLKKFH